MSAKKRAIKSHPDYSTYEQRFNEIWMQYIDLMMPERAEYPKCGSDVTNHPENPGVLQWKMNQELIALQKEYSHLFREVPGESDDEDD